MRAMEKRLPRNCSLALSAAALCDIVRGPGFKAFAGRVAFSILGQRLYLRPPSPGYNMGV